jgi:hypothetical protein
VDWSQVGGCCRGRKLGSKLFETGKARGRIADKARGRIAECDTAEGEEQAVFSEARKKRIGR